MALPRRNCRDNKGDGTKSFFRSGVALVFLACTALSASADPGGPTVLDKGVFSYQAPPGWTVPVTAASLPVAVGPMKNGFAPNIHVDIGPNTKTVKDYVADNLRGVRAAFPDYKLVDQRPFYTTAGLDGIRVVITDTVQKVHLQQTFYFFDGGSEQILVISGCCLAADGTRDAPLFDASIKTFSLE